VRSAGGPPLVAEILRVQRTAGNVAARRLLRQPAPVAPTAPKTDEQQWEDDWNDPAFAGDHSKFNGPDRPAGSDRHRYDVLCPLYRDNGILRPLKFVHDNIIDSDFFGHGTPMHKDLRPKLKAAEKTLTTAGVTTAPFHSCWAFNARTQRNGSWSNHADGKAIDIDADTNPHLTDAQERKVISALTGTDISAANPGAGDGLDSYDAAAQASQRFQDRYTAGGIAERVEEIADEELELDDEREEIADALDLIPTGKGKSPKPTADQKKEATALKAKLAAKQAEIKAKVASRKTLEAEHTRFEALEKAVDDLDKAIETLQHEIDALTAALDLLAKDQPLTAGAAVPTGKEKDKQIKARKTAIVTKTAAIKRKQAQLAAAVARRDKDPLHAYAAHGFLDLSKQLVEALKGAGLGWGGDYTGAKDFMHFEVR
jgi:hypothetical protein